MARSTRPSATADPIALRLGGAAAVQCLLLNVHSFKSTRVGPTPTAADGAAADGGDAAGEGGGGRRRDEAAGAGGDTGGKGGGGPSSAELVDAVSSVLRRAGVPLGLKTQELLDANLRLQAELRAARSDLEEQIIEATRAKEALEAAEATSTCQVCMQRRVDVLMNGCGHVLCSGCVRQISNADQRCPFCRHGLTEGTTRLRWC